MAKQKVCVGATCQALGDSASHSLIHSLLANLYNSVADWTKDDMHIGAYCCCCRCSCFCCATT